MTEMKTENGLSYKQWQFCEEYIRHFNADEAYRKVYSSSQTRNSWIILKSRKVIEYIRGRLEEKKATLDRLSDSANNTLLELSKNGSEMTRINAAKIIKENEIKKEELKLKLNEIELKLLEKDSQKGSNEPQRFEIVLNDVTKKNEN